MPDFLSWPILSLLGAAVGAAVAFYYRSKYFKVRGELKSIELSQKYQKEVADRTADFHAKTVRDFERQLERKEKVIENERQKYEDLLRAVKEGGDSAAIADERWRNLSGGEGTSGSSSGAGSD